VTYILTFAALIGAVGLLLLALRARGET